MDIARQRRLRLRRPRLPGRGARSGHHM